eukprot:symbB.v1.2.005327.t1/scaffold278.1/size243006/8
MQVLGARPYIHLANNAVLAGGFNSNLGIFLDPELFGPKASQVKLLQWLISCFVFAQDIAIERWQSKSDWCMQLLGFFGTYEAGVLTLSLITISAEISIPFIISGSICLLIGLIYTIGFCRRVGMDLLTAEADRAV